MNPPFSMASRPNKPSAEAMQRLLEGKLSLAAAAEAAGVSEEFLYQRLREILESNAYPAGGARASEPAPKVASPGDGGWPHERYRQLMVHGWDVVVLVDRAGEVQYLSESFSAVFGHPTDNFIGKSVRQIVHPDDLVKFDASARDLLKEPNARSQIEIRLRHADGTWHWVEGRSVNLLDEPGIGAVLGTFRDIGDRKRGEEALRRSEERLRMVIEQTGQVVYDYDVATGSITWSGAIEEITGYAPKEFASVDILGWEELIHPDDRDEAMALLDEAAQSGHPYFVEYRFQTKSGQYVWIEDRGKFFMTDEGTALRMIGTMQDVTGRRNAALELQRSEEKYRNLVENINDVIFTLDLDGQFKFVSPAIARISDYSAEDIVGRPFTDFIHPEDLPGLMASLQRTMTGAFEPYECRTFDRSGAIRHVRTNSRLLLEDGEVVGLTGTMSDVTEERRLTEELRKSEERLDLTLKGADLGLWDWNVQTGEVIYNERWAQMLGFKLEELRRHVDVWMNLVHPDDLPIVKALVQAHLDGKSLAYESEHRLRSKSGDWIWVLDRGKVVEWDSEGRPLRAAGTHLDITERKRAEEDRLKLEAQIQQAQKLESLGVLAGGIAHDFNNLLVGILGNADLALLELDDQSESREHVQNIIAAAQRAADLCRQMLAYSGKGRFVVQPISLNEVVHDMAHLLEVSISKSAVLHYDFASGLPAIEVDVTQVRQIIMNLITNASDAIGDSGGMITIRTGKRVCDQTYLRSAYINEELPAGEYVFLEVVDTGCGMDRETLKRIFDPFFSTKFTGRGLGMAAVLGIVRGHRGAIDLKSAPGKGTSFRILFPVSASSPVSLDAGAETPPVWQGAGTVLVVDDEEAVRLFVQKLLRRAGFEVLCASNGEEGLNAFRERSDDIVAVLLDLMMPVMNGEDAFRAMRELRDDVPIVISSGYSVQEAAGRFGEKDTAGFIQKPYRGADLMKLLREVLGE